MTVSRWEKTQQCCAGLAQRCSHRSV